MESKSILVFGAHPDDLEIGMGGTIAKLSAMDYEVQPIIATLPNFVKSDTKEGRKTESMLSAKVMGCNPPVFLDLSPQEMVFGRKFIALIDSLVTKYKPDSVFTQWYGDSHQDHQILTKSVISACRDQDNLFMYETTIPGGITENSFRPQLFVDISDTLDTKKNALECFESQFVRCGEIWIPAIIGRCSYRGYQINSKYAEAFEVVKVTKW
ncbi:MAG TPA: PIG-L family deacetylase [Nitrososphaeraceae archaeon]|jgi:LmbE family N-acetylglucosaminyl deacetylase|nr:PIG-L family deacetylase [Nitrososphaeraceae archaeon]